MANMFKLKKNGNQTFIKLVKHASMFILIATMRQS